MNQVYDVVIVGAGPAGLTAALYCARAELRTVVIHNGPIGGQIAITDRVENFPGFPEGILGPDLGARIAEQSARFGAEFLFADVAEMALEQPEKLLQTSSGDVRARTVIVATGASHRTLDCPGEREYAGAGVSYCATCDGAFFKGEDLVVVGGGDSALEEALFLTRYARSVTIVHRRDRLRAQKVLQSRAFANECIRFRWNAEVDCIEGDAEGVQRVIARDVQSGERSAIPCHGVFVAVGMIPGTGFLPSLLQRDGSGYLVVSPSTETAIPGVFAVGDCRQQVTRQAVVAAGDGCVAAVLVERYLAELQSAC